MAVEGVRPWLLATRDRLSPLLLSCEHATRRLTAAIGPRADERRVLATHWGWDIGGWALTRVLVERAKLEAIGGRWSRLLIDLNRRADDPTLIRRRAGDAELSWNANLDAREIERRIAAYHTPYHAAFDALIVHRVVRGVRPILVSVHTFTPVLDGSERRLDVGVLFEHHETLARRLGRSLARSGLSVRYNEPYSGLAGMMYSADRHGSHHRLECVELEVNQALLATPAQIARIGAAIAPALLDLSRYAGGRKRP